MNSPPFLTPKIREQADRAAPGRICLLVLGMHRSGTSAIARVLSLVGAKLPASLMGPGKANATGHWESSALVHYHDRLLELLGSDWRDWRALEIGRVPLERRRDIKTEIGDLLAAEFGDAPLFVVKDPRICRFAPLFLEALEAAGIGPRIVHMLRNPLEVAESLEGRDGLQRTDAVLQWLRHALDSEAATRSRSRVIISYAALLKDWRTTLESLTEALQVVWPYSADEISDQVARFLDIELRHHTHTPEDVLFDPAIRDWVGEAYAAMLVLEQNPGSEAAQRTLDSIRREFNHAGPVLHKLRGEMRTACAREGETALEERNRHIAALSAEIEERAGHIAALEEHIGQAEKRIAEARAVADNLQEKAQRYLQTITERDDDVRRLESALEQAEGKSAALQADVMELTAGRAKAELGRRRVESELRSAQDTLATMRATVSWRLTTPLRYVRRRQLVLGGRCAGVGVAVRDAGGLGRTLMKAFRVVVREGLGGLKQRWVLLEGGPAAPPQPQPPARAEARPSPAAAKVEQDATATGALDLVTSTELLFPDQAPEPLDCSVSVIIPTLNAGPEFVYLLRKLRQQAGVGRVEIVIVDSGSTDATLATAEAFNCKVVTIDAASFTHSYARNLGASHATGELFLFTVQDAFPIGDYWLYALTSTLVNSRKANPKLAALSCAEYPRTDSELMYDSAIDTHYEFLGCSSQDRVGTLGALDHLALRSQGQLSDVACLIPSALFRSYEYQGSYAEDLDLGIRLLRDGYNVAMLSSVRVIHSHNRDACYHLQRSCTDVVFLVRKFHDFPMPNVLTFRGSVVGAARILARLDRVLTSPAAREQPKAYIEQICGQCSVNAKDLPGASLEDVDVSFGCRPFAEFIKRHGFLEATPLSAAERKDVHAFADLLCARLRHIGVFAERVYPVLDERVRREIHDATVKTLSSSLGIQLGFAILNAERKGSGACYPEANVLLGIMTGGI